MSVALPSTQEVSDNLIAQIELGLGQSIPFLPKSFTRVLAKALAGTFALLYKYAGFIFLQMFVAYATMEETTINGRVIRPLVEWGRLIGVGDPYAATRAEVAVSVSVQRMTGSLPAQSQLVHASSGVLYLTTSAVLLNASTVTVTAIASSDQGGGGGYGAIGNRVAGDVLQFANPLPNVARNASVLSQTVQGAESETVDAYRARIIRRFQRKPQGGARADYQQWGELVPGVLNVYPYAGSPGEVNVYVEATESSSGSQDGIPTSAQLLQVIAAIDADDAGLPSRRPVSAAVNALPITRRAFDLLVTGLVADDVAGAQSAIREAIDDHLRLAEPFITGLSTLPRRDRVTQAAVSGIIDEAVSAFGGSVTTVSLLTSSTPIAAYTLAAGEKAKLGNTTFA